MLDRMRGITLLDVVAAIAILSLITQLALPQLDGLVVRAARRAAVNAFLVSVHQARSTAIRRNASVVICPLDEAERCDPDMDWSSGWLVYHNLNGDWPPNHDPDEPVLHRYSPSARISILANRQTFGLFRIGLRNTNGTVVFCDANNRQPPKAVIVSYTGRPRVSDTRADGTPLKC